MRVSKKYQGESCQGNNKNGLSICSNSKPISSHDVDMAKIELARLEQRFHLSLGDSLRQIEEEAKIRRRAEAEVSNEKKRLEREKRREAKRLEEIQAVEQERLAVEAWSTSQETIRRQEGVEKALEDERLKQAKERTAFFSDLQQYVIYEVAVPEGTSPGSNFSVLVDGQSTMVTCPSDHQTGMKVLIRLPKKPS